MEEQKKSTEPSLGYFFHPRRHPHAPGYPQVDVVLRATPTYLHFDPEHMWVAAACVQGHLSAFTIHHPWIGSRRRYQLGAGRVLWSDRKEKTIEVFTFGGKFVISSSASYTVATLTSSAPIILLSERQPIATLLAVEAEILLAERRAVWLHNMHTLEKRLICLEPEQLYVATLYALQDKFKTLNSETENELFDQFAFFLSAEIHRLHNQRRHRRMPELAELL